MSWRHFQPDSINLNSLFPIQIPTRFTSTHFSRFKSRLDSPRLTFPYLNSDSTRFNSLFRKVSRIEVSWIENELKVPTFGHKSQQHHRTVQVFRFSNSVWISPFNSRACIFIEIGKSLILGNEYLPVSGKTWYNPGITSRQVCVVL